MLNPTANPTPSPTPYPTPCLCRCLVVLLLAAVGVGATAAPTEPHDPVAAAALDPDILGPVVRDAFAAVHRGLSTDAVLADNALLTAFDDRVRVALTAGPTKAAPSWNPAVDTFAARWMLLRLRKSGRLNVPTTRRVKADPDAPAPPPRDTYAPAAEIAARLTLDRFGGSLDATMCDPERRARFDAEAARLSADLVGVTPTLLRSAALGLRKARRLRPELTVRIADWGRTLATHRAADLVGDLDQIPRVPGVYLFRDAEGYLYIGEAKNLRVRLTQHLSGEGQPALTAYLGVADLDALTIELHAFAPESNARLTAHRRAYESELIDTRQPKFNVRP